jgi:hypothetical protein
MLAGCPAFELAASWFRGALPVLEGEVVNSQDAPGQTGYFVAALASWI